MATYTSTSRAKHVTAFTANTEDIVTLANPYPFVEVINDGTVGLYFTLNTGQTDQNVAAATVQGDACFYVGPGAVRTVTDDRFEGSGNRPAVTVVHLISAGTGGYHVTGVTIQ